jgi:hypothetical protein
VRNDSLLAAKCKFRGITAGERGRRKMAHHGTQGSLSLNSDGLRGENYS